MKTLLTILIICLSLFSCKKKETQPEPEQPKQSAPVSCTILLTDSFDTYYTYNTQWVDTVYMYKINNTCPNEVKYKLVDLADVFDSWGVAIPDRDYYVPVNTLEIVDTLKMQVDSNYIKVSMKVNGTFTPFLPLPDLRH
jgi:hypothetical protein